MPIENRPDIPDLSTSRAAVIGIKGVLSYIPSPDTLPTVEQIDAGLETMTDDLLKQMDAVNMRVTLSNNLAMSDQEADTFFSGERAPFESKVRLSPNTLAHREERREELTAVGRYLLARWEDQKTKHGATSDQAEVARGNLSFFLENAVLDQFGQEELVIMDMTNGLDSSTRPITGEARPKSEVLEALHASAVTVAGPDGDAESLYQQALAASEGGNLALAYVFLNNKAGDPAMRQVLTETFIERRRNRELTTRKLQMVWEIEKFRQGMGIDLEKMHEISGFPPGAEIDKNIIHFLTRRDYVAETWRHLYAEAEEAMREYRPGEPVHWSNIMLARAHHYEFADEADTPEQIQAKLDRVNAWLKTILPLGFVESDTYIVRAPTAQGAAVRASNTMYYNREGEQVNVVVVNPRDSEKEYAATVAHELGHALHVLVLAAAEAHEPNFPQRSFGLLPNGIKEIFSQLVEKQIKDLMSGVTESSEKGEKQKTKFADLLDAIVSRRQGPFALVQRAVRIEMENMYKADKRDTLTSDEANHLIDIIDNDNPAESMVAKWYALGIPLVTPTQTIQNNIAANLDDGLVYLQEEMTPDTDQGEEEERQKDDSLEKAFETKFNNKNWILLPEARAVLYRLLGETGVNRNPDTYAQFVADLDPQEAMAKLQEWGVTPDLI